MTVIFNCGWECQQAASVSGLAGQTHWASPTGAPSISTSVVHGSGAASLLVDTTGGAATTIATRTLTAGTRTLAFRFYFRLETAPSGTAHIFSSTVAPCHIDVTSSRVLRAVASNSGSFTAGPTLALNTWYLIEGTFDTSGTTYTVNVTVDGGTNTQDTEVGQTAADMTAFRIGCNGALTMKAYFDDLIVSDNTADHPLGPGECLLSEAVSTGTHSFTAGDFQDEASSNLGTSETATHVKVDEIPVVNTDFVKQVVARAAGYVEYKYRTRGRVPKAVEQVIFVHNTSTNDCNQKAQLYDGTTAVDTAALTFVGTSANALRWYSKQFATPPSGGVWTANLFDLLKGRWGFATDVTNPPALDATFLEADFPLATNAAAGLTTGTGAANDASKTLKPSAAATTGTGAVGSSGRSLSASIGLVSATGAAGTAGANVAPPLTTGAATGAALDATVSVEATTYAIASAATGTGAAGAIVPSVGASGAAAAATGASSAPGMAVAAPVAAFASATGAAASPVTQVAPYPGSAAGTGAAAITVGASLNIAVSTNAFTGTAYNPAPVSTVPVAAATGTGAASNPGKSISFPASVAAATGVANNASITTSAFTSAAAIGATGTGAVLTTRRDILASIGSAAATGASFGTGIASGVLVTAGAATGTGAVGESSRLISFPAAATTGTGAASGTTSFVSPSPDVAEGLGVAGSISTDLVVAYEAGWLMTMGVSGRRWERTEPFFLGAIRVRIDEPFDVLREEVGRVVYEPFWIIGDLNVTTVEPFNLSGPIHVETMEHFNMLDGTVNVYDEGGIASPQTGWFDMWGDD